jgi:DNA-binding NarL/FixJ family response regulator
MTERPGADAVFEKDVDRRIAQLVLKGQPNKAIATATGLPVGTVKWRLHRMYLELGVSSRSQFVLAVRDLFGPP